MAFGILPVALLIGYAYGLSLLGALNFDFEIDFWEPGAQILAGGSPYVTPTREVLEGFDTAVYPPPVLLAFAPLSLLPLGVASVIWSALLVGALFVALRVLGVRDWRCYTLVLAVKPVLDGLVLGNVTPLLLLVAALAWRFRNRTWVVAACVAAAVAVKLFLWPLVVWLLVTRRVRPAVLSVAIAAVTTVAAWGAIGFAGLTSYPSLLSGLKDVWGPRSHSLSAALQALGVDTRVALAVAITAGVATLALAAAAARSGDGDRRAFSLSIVAALLLTPVAWPHYFALLVIPVALARPRLSGLWVAMLGFWAVLFFPAPTTPTCCRPDDVPPAIWDPLHSPIPFEHRALFLGLFAAIVVVALARRTAPVAENRSREVLVA